MPRDSSFKGLLAGERIAAKGGGSRGAGGGPRRDGVSGAEGDGGAGRDRLGRADVARHGRTDEAAEPRADRESASGRASPHRADHESAGGGWTRRPSYIRHQSAAGVAGRLTLDQRGLFDSVLVDAIGGEHNDGVNVSTSQGSYAGELRMEAKCLTSMACALTLDARS